MNSANNEKFDHSQLKAYFFYFDFSAKDLIRHFQPHLLYFNNNLFKKSIERALKPNKLI